MEVFNLFWRNVKWRFQNPVTFIMTMIQPIIWLLLFSTMFGNEAVKSNQSVSYTGFILPGILVMVVLTSSGISGIANYSLKAGGSFYRIYIAPVRRSSIVMGHIGDSAVFSFIEIFVILALAFWLGVRIESGIPGFLLMLVLLFMTVFFISGISYAISFLFDDENPFIAIVNTFMLPLFFLSTALMPYERIPAIFKIPVLINPCTHIINSLRNLISSNSIDISLFLWAAGLSVVLDLLSFGLAVHGLQTNRK